jgi:hypothetical protein
MPITNLIFYIFIVNGGLHYFFCTGPPKSQGRPWTKQQATNRVLSRTVSSLCWRVSRTSNLHLFSALRFEIELQKGVMTFAKVGLRGALQRGVKAVVCQLGCLAVPGPM